MISIIAAVARNGVIGRENKLPWDLPEDLKKFKELTSGNTVVMGRKTFESIGRPLPDRNNVVVTRKNLEIDGVDVVHSIPEALVKARSYGKEVFVIGGGKVYEQTMALADRLYISHVDMDVEGDAKFPVIGEEWRAVDREPRDGFEFVVYEK